jgi:hypothetical protein
MFNIGLQMCISCDIHVERVAQEARQGALKPYLTDFSKYRRHKANSSTPENPGKNESELRDLSVVCGR